MLVKCQRPPACQVLALCPKDVGRHTHPNRIVAPQVDQAKVRRGRDLRIAPLGQLQLLYWKIVDKTFAAVAEHRFEEAHLQGAAEVENAKAIGIDTAPRVAEPAR
jgi:hypothetical protein